MSVPRDERDQPAEPDAWREDDCDSDQRQGAGEGKPEQDQDAQRTGPSPDQARADGLRLEGV